MQLHGTDPLEILGLREDYNIENELAYSRHSDSDGKIKINTALSNLQMFPGVISNSTTSKLALRKEELNTTPNQENSSLTPRWQGS